MNKTESESFRKTKKKLCRDKKLCCMKLVCQTRKKNIDMTLVDHRTNQTQNIYCSHCSELLLVRFIHLMFGDIKHLLITFCLCSFAYFYFNLACVSDASWLVMIDNLNLFLNPFIY